MGQKIGEFHGLGAPIHASVSGTVKAVEPRPYSMGGNITSVVIENDMQDEVSEEVQAPADPNALSVEEMVEIVKNAGIVGMGGATFPTHVKLSVPPGKKAECLIINGVECEPYLTSDHRTMLEHGEELIVGVTILMRPSVWRGLHRYREQQARRHRAPARHCPQLRRGRGRTPQGEVPAGAVRSSSSRPSRAVRCRPARTADRCRCRGLQRLDDLCRLPGRAEGHAAHPACGDHHRKGASRAEEPADPHGYARLGADRGGRGASGRWPARSSTAAR